MYVKIIFANKEASILTHSYDEAMGMIICANRLKDMCLFNDTFIDTYVQLSDNELNSLIQSIKEIEE